MSKTGSATEPRAAPSSSESLYARIIEEIRGGGLSTEDMSAVIGVADRQIRNWSSGEHSPSGKNRDKLLELQYVVGLLREVYDREGAGIWLHGRKRSLGARRPVDLLAEGEYEQVWDAIDRLSSGAM